MTKLSELFSARVPRYTSYPTAPHFHERIDQSVYRQWLGELPPGMPLSLYIHVPFCDTLCWFCGCHTRVVNHYKPVRDYCKLLLKEIALIAQAGPGGNPVQHIHWGGGSPTMLEADDIGRLDDAIRLHFDVRPDAEFAVEIDPRGLGKDTVQAFAAAGVTRASIGVQDCDPEVQRTINRNQSEKETVFAIKLMRDVGVSGINIDLLYGLPRQTLASWEKTLDFALAVDADRLAIFGYAHVPAFKKHQALIPENLLPDLETRFQMALRARDILCAKGYVPIGLDHFAKPHDSLTRALAAGSLRRNFQGYTTDDTKALIGFGASAIGSLPQGYVQNTPTVSVYRTMVNEGALPVVRGIELTDEDRMRRDVIERLMCNMSVDLDEIAGKFCKSRSVFADSLVALQSLAREGIVEIAGGRVGMSPGEELGLRLAAAAFDLYLPRHAALHSVSV